MATLHMDTDQVRATKSKIQEAYGAMTQSMSDTNNLVNSTVGAAWQGGSATEFQSQFESIRSQITPKLEELQELANKLETEIAQWETMSQRMG